MGTLGMDRPRCVLPQRKDQLACSQRPVGMATVVDRPLELDPLQLRRSVFEADHGHIALGLFAVAQGRRRWVLEWRCAHARGCTHDPKNITGHTDKRQPLLAGDLSSPKQLRRLVRRAPLPEGAPWGYRAVTRLDLADVAPSPMALRARTTNR